MQWHPASGGGCSSSQAHAAAVSSVQSGRCSAAPVNPSALCCRKRGARAKWSLLWKMSSSFCSSSRRHELQVGLSAAACKGALVSPVALVSGNAQKRSRVGCGSKAAAAAAQAGGKSCRHGWQRRCNAMPCGCCVLARVLLLCSCYLQVLAVLSVHRCGSLRLGQTVCSRLMKMIPVRCHAAS